MYQLCEKDFNNETDARSFYTEITEIALEADLLGKAGLWKVLWVQESAEGNA